jgi:hypothetical protein
MLRSVRHLERRSGLIVEAEVRPQGRDPLDGRTEGGAIVDDAAVDKERDDVFDELVLEAVRVSVDQVDDLVLVDQPPKDALALALRQGNRLGRSTSRSQECRAHRAACENDAPRCRLDTRLSIRRRSRPPLAYTRLAATKELS